MPYYEFFREARGPFERLLGFGEARRAAPCPSCSSPARRAYSMPGVISVSTAEKKARSINERGSEPKISRKPEPARKQSPHPVRGGRPWQISH